ncbi:MAG: AmmeMemoRadiSam system radical SAM enzyme [Phycisphaerae bacterium]|nr:AmmeMemoRadiSam system radical SAM enzyme [Phycisphaerae bacterium]
MSAVAKAVLWHKETGDDVRCDLCAFRCSIKPDHVGVCQIRKNIGGELFSLNYHAVTSWHTDPVEKKPLFHFLPGSRIFSLACAGCNFRCSFCQNWEISQAPREFHAVQGRSVPPEAMVQAAIEDRCQSMAYTYTEPTIFMEYAFDCAKLAAARGLKNVFVSNGFMTIEAIEYVRPYLHAINVDLKAFTDEYYRVAAKAMLAPVLDTLRYLVHKTDIWTEITTLIVPGANDSEDELTQLATFIARELKPSVPWHVSRFHPDYKMTDKPATPETTIRRAVEIGLAAGLRYVYAGNLWAGDDTESTRCHSCRRTLIERRGYTIRATHLVEGNKCPACGTELAGVF